LNNEKIGTLIIGGGIIGLSIGYYLSKKEFLNVEIVEKEAELSSHASGHNAGGISTPHETQSEDIWPLARETCELYERLAMRENFDFDYVLNGTIVLLKDSRLSSELEKRIEKFREKSGTRVRLLTPQEVKDKEENLSLEEVGGAIFYPDDAQGNSKKLGHCFERVCREKGMKLATSVEVLGFTIDNGTIETVKTSIGTVFPERVVVAAGPWSGRIASMLGIEIPIEPVKGHLITTHAANTKILNSFISGPNYYVLQSSGGNLVVGGGEDHVAFDSSIMDSRIAEAWAEGISLVPALSSLGQQSTTACLRPYASGGLPVIGESKRYKNLIFATGHFRSGFSLAPVTGKIVSELIVDGRTKTNIGPFSPERFAA